MLQAVPTGCRVTWPHITWRFGSIPAPSHRWVFKKNGLLNGTLSHAFGTPGTISCFHLRLIPFVFWFWGGELLRTASAHTKLQAAARQRPCRWPLFTKLMEAESLQLQMVVPTGKCVNSRYASQIYISQVGGGLWWIMNHDTSPSILAVSLSWLPWKRLGNCILKHSIEFLRTVQGW